MTIKKIVLGMAIFIIISSIVLALNLNVFTDSSNSGNLIFTGDENITKNISIYQFANITNAKINITSNITDWGNLPYNYRKKLIVSENSGVDLLNYSLYIELNNVANLGLCSGLNFYDENYNLLSDMYIESCGNPLKVWVRTNFTANSDKIIYMYWGNTTSVSSTSNIASTYWFKDDFSTDQIGTIWTKIEILNNPFPEGGGCVAEISGGRWLSYGNHPFDECQYDIVMNVSKYLPNASSSGFYVKYERSISITGLANTIIGYDSTSFTDDYIGDFSGTQPNTFKFGSTTIYSDQISQGNLISEVKIGQTKAVYNRLTSPSGSIGNLANYTFSSFTRSRLGLRAGVGTDQGTGEFDSVTLGSYADPAPTITDNPEQYIKIANLSNEWDNADNRTIFQKKQIDFTNSLRSILNSSCSGGIIEGNNCTIPFIFHSSTQGNITYSDLNIIWTEQISPNLTILEPLGNKNSLNISYNVTLEDYELDTCLYWINSTIIDILNTTISCNNTSGNVLMSNEGTYTFNFFSNDTSGNTNMSSTTFTISLPQQNSGGSGTGAVGGSGLNLTAIISLKQPNNLRYHYSDLERAVIYARINDYCTKKYLGQIVKSDYSAKCDLSIDDVINVTSLIDIPFFRTTQNDIFTFLRFYKEGKLIQTFATKQEIEKYNLFTSVLGITNPLTLNPSRVDTLVFINEPKGNPRTIPFRIDSNKPLTSCEVLEGNFTCIVQNSTIRIEYLLNDTNFFSNSFTGIAHIKSQDSEQLFSINFKVRNLGFKYLFYISGLVVLIFLIYIFNRKS